MKTPKLQKTTDYKRFTYVQSNRTVNLQPKRRQDLRESMEKHGYLEAYPLYCTNGRGRLVIRDGQHRLAVARELGLPVYYVVCEQAAAIPMINTTQVAWGLKDYAQAFAAEGNPHYAELQDFALRHGLPLSICVSVLSNETPSDGGNNGNVLVAFRRGDFKVTSRAMGDRVASLYSEISRINREARGRWFLSALFAVCLIPGFDGSRLVKGARRCREAIQKYGSRDGYLQMIETLYNYGRRTKEPVKISAENVLASRNPSKRTA